MFIRDALRTLRFKQIKCDHNQLYTVWGEQLNPGQVLAEYPRPQMKRDNYTILNGYWNYCISPDTIMPEHYDGRILVPFSPESVLSGVNRGLKPGEFLWYERILAVDRKPMGRRCLLHFGAVDQSCEVYVNHQKAGEHVGGYLPFTIDITARLDEGTNLLSLKVWDDTETSYHSRGKQKLKRGGLFYTAQSGIWQTVWLEWVPELYIKYIRITPQVDAGSVRLEIKINDDFKREGALNTVFRVMVYDRNKLLQTVNSRVPVITIPMPKAVLWSPENPYLYSMAITAGSDLVESYFAMRKIEIKTDEKQISRIYLNNKPYFQAGLLDQGYWPDGLYTAPSDEAMIYDIMKAKELGYNMLRKHIKIEPLRWYYHCDRLGMLVWQDMVNGGGEYNLFLVGKLPTLFPCFANKVKDNHYGLLARKDAKGREEWTRECEATVHHLYNSPSIVTWVPFNEAWGQFDARKAYERIRELDATRLVDHASGWFDQGCGDFKSDHNYFHTLRVRKEKRPYVLSEFGGYACHIPEHTFSIMVFGYRIFFTAEALDDAYHKLMEKEIGKLVQNGLSACVYTQLSDVEDEINGLMTYDRKICKVTPIKPPMN